MSPFYRWVNRGLKSVGTWQVHGIAYWACLCSPLLNLSCRERSKGQELSFYSPRTWSYQGEARLGRHLPTEWLAGGWNWEEHWVVSPGRWEQKQKRFWKVIAWRTIRPFPHQTSASPPTTPRPGKGRGTPLLSGALWLPFSFQSCQFHLD